MDAPLPVIIVGGGLAGAFAAIRLAERRPDIPLLLLEAGSSFGGNHTWSFFDSDVPPHSPDLIAALNPVRWPRHRVRFETRERVFETAYNTITAAALDALVRVRLPSESWQLNAAVSSMTRSSVLLQSGERIAARAVIDARGPSGAMPGLDLGWQKFVGIEFAAKAAEPDCATVMDARIPQIDGYRFYYVLPLAPDRVLVEDTYYSDSPELDVPAIAARVRELASQNGLLGAELRQETGVLPILIGGDPEVFWPRGDPIARLGLAGGFFHATTGYSFGMALQIAEELSQLSGDLVGGTLADWTRQRFMQHWRAMGFFRMLNTMLFRAAKPAERHMVFAHFYRLPAKRVARFYAGVPSLIDKARILSGKPPVPISAALRALLRG